MPTNPNKLSQFWQDLKRRKVLRVITVYAAVAFVILQLVEILEPSLRLPEWTMNFILVILIVGFVIAVILSWIYDVHPEGGIVKTESAEEVKAEDVPQSSNSWKIASYISFIVIIGLILFHILATSKGSRKIANLETSIAVLPFENMSIDEEDSHLGRAFTDEIIMELQKIKAFDRVLSYSSTMQYAENRPTIPEIAEKLNVNYLVEGSIQRHEEDVSIRIQVIRAKHEDHVWGDEYDGKWEDIFSIQDEIALKVANKLKTVLSPEEIRKIEKNPTENLDAYNLYLQGRFFWHRRTEKDLNRSIYYFNQAIELDTTYALAYAGLADAYFIKTFWGWFPADDGCKKGKQFAIKALSINNNISEAHATLGGIATWYEWEWEDAEKELKLAISLNPNYATAHQYYSELLDVLGRNREAREQITHAVKLNPYSAGMFIVSANQYYRDAQYEKTIEESKRALEIIRHNINLIRIIKCYLRLDMNNEAFEMIEEIVSMDPSDNQVNPLDQVYHESGIEGVIHKFIFWMLSDEAEIYFPVNSMYFTIASLYGLMGDAENSMEYLERSFSVGESEMPRINNNPDFDLLKTDSRFEKLLKSMNL